MTTSTGFGYQGPPPPDYYPPPPKFQSGLTGYDGFQSSQPGYQQQGPPYPPYPPSGYTITTTGYPSNVVAPLPQQQQQVVVINSLGQTTPAYRIDSFTGQVALSCIVFWFFNWIFGLIAFILASMANSTAVSDPNGARVLGRASYGVSIAGIVTSVIIVAIVVGVIVGSPSYYYYGYY